jgi:hypothetical protein
VTQIGVSGKVQGGDLVGGIAGYSYGTDYLESYAEAMVKGDSLVGGLLGYSYFGRVTDAYFRGSVTGRIGVAGLLGGLYSNGYVSKSYVAGKISGETDVDLLVGPKVLGDYVATSTLWDNEFNVINKSIFGTGYSTSEMKDQTTFGALKFDFTNIWSIDPKINNGYPYLMNLGKPTATTPNRPVVASKAVSDMQLHVKDGWIMRLPGEEGRLQAVDLQGKLVRSTTAERLSVGELRSGSYIAVFRAQTGAVTYKRFSIR